LEITQSITVSTAGKIPLQAMGLDKDDLENTYQLNQGEFKNIILAFILIALIVFLTELYLYFRGRKSIKSQFKEILEGPLEDAPYSLPFPNKVSGIKTERDIYELSQGLQQRVIGDINRLDLPATIRATAKEAGLLELKYKPHFTNPEYLILIDGSSDKNHQSKLFEYLAHTLKKENVLMDIFYFDVSPRFCYNGQFPQGVSLEQLHQKYPDHRLMIFGQAHQLIHSHYPKFRDWVELELGIWEHRMIFTPIQYESWGYHEKLLQSVFTLLPVDIKGELLVLQALQNFDNQHLKKELNQLDWELSSLIFNSKEDVRRYLGNDTFLYYWLASLAIYPKPNWNLTLAIGKALWDQCQEHFSDKQEQSVYNQITYSSVLKISRIPWLQEGNIPDDIRLQLLDSLPVEIERTARRTLLEVLDEINLPTYAVANRELKIQKATHQYLLEPSNPYLAATMYELWVNDLVVDLPLKKHITNHKQKLLGSASHLLFKRMKRFKPLVTLSIVMVFLVTGLLINRWSNNQETLKGIVENKSWVGLNLIRTAILDSAVYYNNLGADSLTSLDRALIYFDSALFRRNDYHVARRNKEHGIFNKAKKFYQQDGFQQAIDNFRILNDTTEIQFDGYYGLALSHYYLGNLDSARYYQDTIQALDPTYYDSISLPELEESKHIIASIKKLKNKKRIIQEPENFGIIKDIDFGTVRSKIKKEPIEGNNKDFDDFKDFYDNQTLQYWNDRYSVNIKSMFQEELSNLIPTECAINIDTPTLPMFGFYAFNFYAHGNTVVIPISSVLFLDQISTAFVWLTLKGKGYSVETILDYLGMLKHQSFNTYPLPWPTLGIPTDPYIDPQVDQLSQELLKTAILWIMAHEAAHICMGHESNSIQNEYEADQFAMDVFRKKGYPPKGLITLFIIISNLQPSEGDFASKEEWGYYRNQRNFPLSGDRLERMAKELKISPDQFVRNVINPAPNETQKLLELSQLLENLSEVLNNPEVINDLTNSSLIRNLK